SARGVTRVAVLRDPALASGPGQVAAIQSMAPSLGVEVSPVNVRNAPEIERTVAAFARSTHGGLIVTGSALVAVHRHLIIALAARHKLPAVYVERSFAAAGGLVSYAVFCLKKKKWSSPPLLLLRPRLEPCSCPCVHARTVPAVP